MKIRTLTLLLLAANLTVQAKDIAYTSSWHDGETVEMATDATLKPSTSSSPRIRLTVAARVDIADDGFTFGDGSVVEIRNGGTLEINHNVTFGNNCRIYAEDGAIIITKGKSLTAGQGTTLYLHHHSVQGNGTLLGDFAQIDAPMTEVFAPTVNVGGNWSNDRVYPQWFGAVAYPSLAAASASGSVCSARAIESAAAMAQGAEVFVPKGYYAVKQPISMPTGVKLRGCSSLDFVDDNNLSKTKDCFGTVLVATSFLTNGKDDYMIRINAGTSLEWDRPYPKMCSEISHLSMYNSDNSALVAIYAADSARLDNIVFHEFIQAVKYADIYLDNKAVTNCTFCLNSSKSEKRYAFDFGYLGDALLFEHNAIHTGKFNNGIKIVACGGGSINANIINADNLISSSKAINFTANHIEQGHVLTIESSSVAFRSNYFWVDTVPVVQIHGSEYDDQSVVSMDGDIFNFYGTAFYGIKSNTEKLNPHITSEIQIDENVSLNLSNCHRYWIGNTFGKGYKTGILISDKSGNPLEAFNNFSYVLSQRVSIATNYQICSDFSPHIMDKQRFSLSAMSNDGIYWLDDSGEYRYCYQIIFDKSRQIGWPQNELLQLPIYGIGNSVNIEKKKKEYSIGNTKTIIETAPGILLHVQSGFSGILRLVRESVKSSKSKYVDIPICGASFLYDNGVSVNGYPWVMYNDKAALTQLTEVDGVEYHNSNARIYTPRRIGKKLLKPGDSLFNSGDDSSWTMEYIH